MSLQQCCCEQTQAAQVWLTCAARQPGSFGVTETEMCCKSKLRAETLQLNKDLRKSYLSQLLFKES